MGTENDDLVQFWPYDIERMGMWLIFPSIDTILCFGPILISLATKAHKTCACRHSDFQVCKREWGLRVEKMPYLCGRYMAGRASYLSRVHFTIWIIVYDKYIHVKQKIMTVNNSDAETWRRAFTSRGGRWFWMKAE